MHRRHFLGGVASIAAVAPIGISLSGAMAETGMKVIRGSFLDFVADPFYQDEQNAARYVADGLLAIDGDRIADFGPWDALAEKYAGNDVITYPGRLIMPGFVDTHVHYPQTEMIAAFGEQLLEWLEKIHLSDRAEVSRQGLCGPDRRTIP